MSLIRDHINVNIGLNHCRNSADLYIKASPAMRASFASTHMEIIDWYKRKVNELDILEQLPDALIDKMDDSGQVVNDDTMMDDE